MLCATKVRTASRTVASSSMEKSIFLYPLNSAASPAVKAVPTVLMGRTMVALVVVVETTLLAAVGKSRNMVWYNGVYICVVFERMFLC